MHEPTAHPNTAPTPRATPVARRRTLLCGPIVKPTTLLDVMNMLAVSGWTGELHVHGPDSHYRLTLHQGGLQSASSSVPGHRLGALLVEAGVVSASQLAPCLRQLGGERRIGELLVQRGLLSRDALFEALRDQAQTIFYRALTVDEGSFAFTELASDADAPPIAFHLPIQHLLLEGARRIDERERLRRDDAAEQVRCFSTVLRHIFAAVEPHGHCQHLHDHVAQWIAGCGLAGLLGDDLRPDGSIEPARLIEQLQVGPQDQALAVYRMLHELTTFTLFAAAHGLPRSAERRLSAQVTRALRTIPVPPAGR